MADAAGALDAARRELEPEGTAVACRELPGTSAAHALHELSETEDAGLLVVGSTRRGAVGRVLPGSTAQRLMHGAPCPLAIVPAGWEAGGALRHDRGRVRRQRGRPRGTARRPRARGPLGRRAARAHGGQGRLARYGETEAQTAEQRGKEFDEVEGELRVRAEEALGARPRASAATWPSRRTCSSRIPPTSWSASPSTSICSSAAPAATDRCARFCWAAYHAA